METNTTISMTISDDKAFTQALSNYGDCVAVFSGLDEERDGAAYEEASQQVSKSWDEVTAAADNFAARLVRMSAG